ncbi:MAG: bifunctional fructose-bisphosphatase/inositol-phosphate phosphatase [Candidatus Methanoperedens sp.]|nr:bifunctional fructose-bisphosphatase/inositol-phosphate phosphatase [Candidatus Methanoperedens sp.]
MNDSQYYKLCNDVTIEIKKATLGLIGKPEAGEILRIGADGTPTDKIDDVAENAALSVLENDGRSMLFISEELGEKRIGGKPEFTFVLDPIDGTFNAVNNIPFFCVPIAIGRSDLSDIKYGFVKNLVNDDIYFAEKGKGAFLNNRKIHVSNISEISKLSVLSYSHRPNAMPVNNHNVRRVRVYGSAGLELCYVAAGLFDAFFDMRGMLRITDIAASKIIVEEAGGMITDDKGGKLLTPLNVRERLNMIASNGFVHDELLKTCVEE